MATNPTGQRFDARDLINAANDASKRTRNVTIVLAVASVIVFVGFYNSLDSSWMLQRIRAAYHPNSEFTNKKLHIDIDKDPALSQPDPDEDNKKPADVFRKDFRESLVKSYIDNTYLIKAPFFGVVLDINDVGLIGGIGLFCILVLLRFSLSREIKNLKFAFTESVAHHRLHEFYYQLAIHQVFTIPEMGNETRNRLLSIAPRIVCLVPGLVYSFGVGYDYYTIFVLKLFKWSDNLFLMIFESVCLVILWCLSIICWKRQNHINSIWDEFWSRLNSGKSKVILLESDLVEDFGEDALANKALKDVLERRGTPND